MEYVLNSLANDTTGLGLAGTGNSGILGLSFPLEAAIPDTSGTPILENLLSAFNDSDRYFAVKLGRDRNSSSFTIGKLDPTFANSTNDLAWTAVYPAASSLSPSERDSNDYYDYWKIPLQSIMINSTTFDLSDSRVHGSPTPIAVFDTGTTLILGPSQDVDRFWNSIGGTMKTDDGWKVRCDHGVMIGFVLGTGDSKKEYFVDPADLSWIEGGRDGDWCMGGIQANDAVSVYVLHSSRRGALLAIVHS
ncbi:hypothetical protein EIP86_000482 [Pleurotus ostreatoroseus]|nr:hypothetical protein EIP86_000482 [Pleurotus ostreatoroseus]